MGLFLIFKFIVFTTSFFKGSSAAVQVPGWQSPMPGTIPWSVPGWHEEQLVEVLPSLPVLSGHTWANIACFPGLPPPPALTPFLRPRGAQALWAGTPSPWLLLPQAGTRAFPQLDMPMPSRVEAGAGSLKTCFPRVPRSRRSSQKQAWVMSTRASSLLQAMLAALVAERFCNHVLVYIIWRAGWGQRKQPKSPFVTADFIFKNLLAFIGFWQMCQLDVLVCLNNFKSRHLALRNSFNLSKSRLQHYNALCNPMRPCRLAGSGLLTKHQNTINTSYTEVWQLPVSFQSCQSVVLPGLQHSVSYMWDRYFRDSENCILHLTLEIPLTVRLCP